MGKIKGNEFLFACEYFEQAGGKEGMEKVKTALSVKDRKELFSKPVLLVSWIEYRSYLHFVFTAVKILGDNSGSNTKPELLKGLACYQAQKDFSGIIKVFAKIVTVEYVMKKTTQLWHHYFDTGDARAYSLGKNHVQIELTHFPDIPANHELEQLPYFEEVVRICGGKNVKASHPKCMARGDDCCLIDLKYE